MFSRFERTIALRYLLTRRGFISVITWFSLIGIALGVATLIIVMAVMNGFREELLSRILGINAHITISRHVEGGIANFEDLQQRISHEKGVVLAYPIIEGEVMATASGASSGALVRAIRQQDLRHITMVANNIREGSIEEFTGTNVVMLGARMAERLGLHAGDSITLISPQTTVTVLGSVPRLKDYFIAGIFEIGMYEYDNALILMPLEAGQLYFRYPDSASGIQIFLQDPNKAPQFANTLYQELAPQDFSVLDWKNLNSHYFNALQVERNVMFLILTLIILVAAFNIISSLIMLVKDKQRDIAILRTIGATRGAVMRIFFLCGATIGVVGTLAGFLLGLGFSLNIESIRKLLESLTGTELFAAEIYFLSTLPAKVESDDVILVVAISLTLSFLATIFPAWRAARIDPAQGVRDE